MVASFMKSKSAGVKCRWDGELPVGRKDAAVCNGVGPAVRALHPASFGLAKVIGRVPPRGALASFPKPYVAGEGGFLFMKKDRSLSRRTERALLRLCLSALLAALSIVLGKYLSISTPLFRLSFENLPILMAGIFLGPLAGGIVGGVADLLGCVLVGYTINPIITLGGILVGVLSGLVALLAKPLSGRLDHSPSTPRPLIIWCAVGVAHIVGSMLVKSIGLSVYYGAPLSTLVWRVPLYIVVGAAEGTVLVLLARNKLFTGELNRARSKKERGSRT